MKTKKLNLVKLVKQGDTPLNQYMDKETLQWIVENSPSFGGDNLFLKFNSGLLKIFTPLEEWFADTDRINTIHGIRHLMRVATYAMILSNLWIEGESKKRNIVISSVLHDIRRLTDKNDLNHGERSAKWFLDNIEIIKKQFNIVDFSDDDIEEVYNTIYCHDILSDSLFKMQSYEKHKDSIDIIKAADALDRYCQPKLKWWINDFYLVRIPLNEHKRFAYELVVNSENLYLGGFSSVESIFKSLDDYENKFRQ